MTTVEAPSEPAPLAVGSVVDGYRIESVLGHGGMGFVYGVVNTMIGKRAAMKVLRPELGRNKDVLERFITEARAVNQIGHPNIVDIFGFGTIGDDQPYMVMEWLRGETLGDYMKSGLPVSECCDLLLAIASALEAAHAAGIAHRDLKPDNVFLIRTGKVTSVKLLDFGIAKLLTTDRQMQKTQTGMVMGTPQYMSPEQGRGKDVDQRTDIYSLGVMAFEMFCQRPPFSGETAMDLVIAHIHEPAPAPSSVVEGISPAIDALVLAMLDKSPEARPTLHQIITGLENIRDGRTELATMPPRRAPRPTQQPLLAGGEQATAAPTVVSSPSRSRRMWFALGAAVVVLGGVVAVIALRPNDTEKPSVAPAIAPSTPIAPTPTPTPPVAPATPPAPTTPAPAAAEVTIELASTPSGARVRLAGTTEVIGTTPFTRKFPRGNETQTFELELDGYQVGAQAISMAKDAMVQVALVPTPAKTKPRVTKRKKTNVDRGGTMDVFDE